MKPTLALSAALMITIASSEIFAQQALTGIVTLIDRTRGSVMIQRIPNEGGSATEGEAERYRIANSMLESLHAGDRVSYSFSEANGTRTIVKIEKR